jgi:hypothetical protein
MSRARVWILVTAVALVGLAAGFLIPRPGPPTLSATPPNSRDDPGDWERRVRFVCCDDHGWYSSGVYMRVGGGRAAFDTVREAAPFMRADDPGSAAAGLCGFLFRRFGYQGETVGTLALEPPPQVEPDGTIDWKAYGEDGDVILINVHTGSAKCCFGSMAGHEVHDLPLGGRKIE